MRTIANTPSNIAAAAGTRNGTRQSWVVTFMDWIERRRQRRALSELCPHLLKDVGIDPGLAAREIDKPFWRA